MKQISEIIEDCAQRFESRMSNEMTLKTLHNPCIVILLGDKAAEAYGTISGIFEKKWSNPSDVTYISFGTEPLMEVKGVWNSAFIYDSGDMQSRKAIIRDFLKDIHTLGIINALYDQVIMEVLKTGFRDMNTVRISVVCHADDAINALLPDLTLLLKSKLKEHNPITADLFVCFDDKSPSPLSYAFFRELDYYQSGRFTYKKKIDKKGDYFLDIDYASPGTGLFDSVYMFGTQNIDKTVKPDAMKENYRIIALINYVRNEKIPGSPSRPGCYSTGGYGYVNKPNYLIAAKLIQRFFSRMLDELQTPKLADKLEPLKLLGLDYPDMAARAEYEQPFYEDFLAVMPCAEDAEISRYTNNELLELYDGNLMIFFENNYCVSAKEHFDSRTADIKEFRNVFFSAVNANKINLSVVAEWLKPNGGLIRAVDDAIRYTRAGITELRDELEEKLQRRPKNVKRSYGKLAETTNLLLNAFETMFSLEARMFKAGLVLQIYTDYEAQLLVLRDEFAELEKKLNAMRAEINAALNGYIKNSGANMESYDDAVDDIIREYESKRGEDLARVVSGIFSPVIFAGIQSPRKAQIDESELLRGMYEFFKTVFFSSSKASELTGIPFDEEIISRGVENELFTELVKKSSLNLNFIPTVRETWQSIIYLGSQELKFMRYAVKTEAEKHADSNCIVIDEAKRLEGLERITLYTGFHITDFYYISDCQAVYREAVKNGHEFHCYDSGLLKDFELIKSL